MDAFSAPTSTLVPGSTATASSAVNREGRAFRTPHTSPYPHLSSHKPKSSSSLLQPTIRPPSPLSWGSGQPCAASPRPTAAAGYTRASTGYAAALLDVSRCSGAFEAVERDARRLLPELWQAASGPWAGGAVMKLVDRHGVHRHVSVLMRMLVRRGRVGLVAEVMEEFARLCDELRGTEMVVVTSEGRMAAKELAGIAEKVRRRSGAATVKVRHVVCESSSLA